MNGDMALVGTSPQRVLCGATSQVWILQEAGQVFSEIGKGVAGIGINVRKVRAVTQFLQEIAVWFQRRVAPWHAVRT
jgi:hypothetical protein